MPSSRSFRLGSLAIAALALCFLLAYEAPSKALGFFEDGLVIRPKAKVETEPVPTAGDAADDPAIWIHPQDPSQSLVLGTDKKGGLNVFGLDGKRLQIVSDGARPNNVDVLYGFHIGEEKVDIAVAAVRTKSGTGVAIWRIDPETRKLSELGPVPAFKVFDGGEPYGSCVYQSPRDKSCYVFVTNKDGAVEQYRIKATSKSASNPISAERIRKLKVGSVAEGCVADHELGKLYVSEETVGVWKFSAEPDATTKGELIARVGEHGLTADVEGLTIYYAANSKGYLIASSQGAGTFQIFTRDDNTFVATIDPAAGSISDISDCDGIDVTNVGMSPAFPSGLFVCQDGQRNKDGRQNFKFFAWEDIAGDRLLIDVKRPVRRGR